MGIKDMLQKLSAAVIGCGRMGAFTSDSVLSYAPDCCFPLNHAEAITAHPRLHLKSLCDLNTTTLLNAAKKFDVTHKYLDPFKLINTEKPALLSLATRTLGRAEIILHAIDSGICAIHSEKPLCNSVSELEELTKALDSSDIFFTWGAIRRFFGVYRQALALANSGRYGRLREVRVNMGSASMFWTHPHSIDLLLFAAGGRRIEGVQARLENVMSTGPLVEIDSDPKIVTASVYFEDDFSGHITQGIGCDFILSCETGEILVRADGACLELYSCMDSIYPRRSELEVTTHTDPSGTLGPISQLVGCLDGDLVAQKNNRELKRDIVSAQRIAFAMLQSHLEGSRITCLTLIDPQMVIKAKTNGIPA